MHPSSVRTVGLASVATLLVLCVVVPHRKTLATTAPLPEAPNLTAAAGDPCAPAPTPAAASVSAPAPTETAASVPSAALAGPLGGGHPVRLEDIPAGTALRSELERLAPTLRDQALAHLTRLAVPVEDTNSLHVDPTGALLYACAAQPPPRRPDAEAFPLARVSGGSAALPAAEVTAAPALPPRSALAGAAVPITSPPILHSRPGSKNVIYLDFNGGLVTDTRWNDYYGPASYDCLPFDSDGAPTSFSTTEQSTIEETWARVVEDYAPFDVDVTTEAPAEFTETTAWVLITPRKDRKGVVLPNITGTNTGMAYIDVFGQASFINSRPAFVYFDLLYGEADRIAEAVSHEAGHNLGLSHDGQSGGVEYYYGHGSGQNSWAPIMGCAYGRQVTQWSKGDYYNANNGQDDLAIIASHLALPPDDVGEAVSYAQVLIAGGAAQQTGASLLTTSADSDLFSITTGAGIISATATAARTYPSTYGSNCDLKLELMDAAGAVLLTAAPTTSRSASVSANVAAGTYYVRVSADGVGAPLNNPPSGYTDYGSIGRYSLTGTRVLRAPRVAGPTALSFRLGDTVDFAIADDTMASGFHAHNLPPWLHLDPVTGRITGVASATRVFLPTLGADNSMGLGETLLTLTVADGPPLVGIDSSRTVVSPGDSLTLNATCLSSLQPVTYRWSHDGVEIPGATESVFSTPAVRADAGWYQIEATNAQGAQLSSRAYVLVAPATTTLRTLGTFAYSPAAPITDAVAITAGALHAVALRRSGTVAAWGDNTYGQTNVTADLANVVAIDAGDHHTMALRADGTVAVWGRYADTTNAPPSALGFVTAISAYGDNCLALCADGTIALWGPNRADLEPPADLDVTGIVAIALGRDHVLVLRRDGTLLEWGAPPWYVNAIPPGLVAPRLIAAGNRESYAIDRDDFVSSWFWYGYRSPIPSHLGNAPVVRFEVSDTHGIALDRCDNLDAWVVGADGPTDWIAAHQNEHSVWAAAAGRGFTSLLSFDSPPQPVTCLLSPVAASCMPGGGARFSVRFGGTPTPYLQWSFHDPSTGEYGTVDEDDHHHLAPDGSLVLTNLPAAFDHRTYSCFASNGETYANSDDAVLTVAATWPNYLAERFSAFDRLNPDLAGYDADPDGDGLPNSLEFAFGRDPRSDDGPSPLRLSKMASGAKLTFPCFHGSRDLYLYLQYSPDLKNWYETGINMDRGTITPLTPLLDQVELTPPPTTEGRQFYRLSVFILD